MKVETETIEASAGEVARDLALSLYDIEVAREGPRTILRVFLEREGGIRLQDIEAFSRRFGALLDVEDPLGGPYVLEVSSPGVNRRLRRPEHFEAAVGRRVRVTLAAPKEGRRNLVGILVEAGPGGIAIREKEAVHRVLYAEIRKAQREVTQEELFRKGTQT